jgi:hypothetical protein
MKLFCPPVPKIFATYGHVQFSPVLIWAVFMELCGMVLLVCPRVDVTTLMHYSVVPLPIYDVSCVGICRGHICTCVSLSSYLDAV